MIAQFVTDCFGVGIQWFGAAVVLGFGVSGAINLFKTFGGIR
ncbi:hypothetical protein [Brevibacillus brevis]|uniref:Uncharacterized protein n=1 Tax=Brevibacillus brevis TaxID=1393 RepID=A0ABY9TCS9_BREBE|nr:hypothetical protein [Brevibacillus brevis]WNC17861.1 hypothetical protein RGB73_30090 [Brevibacillus brevis]